jgi:hypothetical protein
MATSDAAVHYDLKSNNLIETVAAVSNRMESLPRFFANAPLASLRRHPNNRDIDLSNVTRYLTQEWGRHLETIVPKAHPCQVTFDEVATQQEFGRMALAMPEDERRVRYGAMADVQTWAHLKNATRSSDENAGPGTSPQLPVLPPWIVLRVIRGQHRHLVLRKRIATELEVHDDDPAVESHPRAWWTVCIFPPGNLMRTCQ